jgi:3D (Asp-Asp-Asp) domain-containing protein/peptidoglycan hydrolase CwlO-like protein
VSLVGCLPPAKGPCWQNRLGPTPAQAGHGNRVAGRVPHPEIVGLKRGMQATWYAPLLVNSGSLRTWIRFAAVGALVVTTLLIASTARADDPATLRSEAERLREENDSLAARSQTALLDLYSLERRLARAEARIADLQARRIALEREAASAQRRLQIARSDHAEAERRLGLRLSQLYVQGEVDPIAVLFAAQSLDEALSAFDGLTRLADQDASILEQLRKARTELRDAAEAVAERRAALDGVLAQAEQEQAALASARSERAAYIDALGSRRELNAAQIADLSAQAEQASESTPPAPEPVAETEPAPEPEATPPGGRQPGGSPMVVDVVAYCGGVGTASGLPLGWGTVAVDTSVFPFGTKMYIPGYGDGVAADRGTAIIGKIIDIWFPTCAQARAWGRQTLTITVYW